MFVGAGLSVAAGYVDWKNLLRDTAKGLELDVSKEPDLIALAQFDVNHREGRNHITQVLIDQFMENVKLTENHRLIASLPIRSIWTTNYDDLIEKAFEEANKRVDVKRRQSDIPSKRWNSDATVYKMHGDRTEPDKAVLTKEDYETYDKSREYFTIALKNDLATKKFLFLGVSFSDPNVAYILSQVKQLLGDNARQHYCLLKKPTAGESGDDDYSCTRFNYLLADLKRYKITPVLIESYAEITTILKDLNQRSHMRNVFISGSAHDCAPLGEDRFRELCRQLGAELIRKGFNVISGYGSGVGSMVIVGAMQSLTRNDDERLQLWPFPQELPAGVDRDTFWEEFRRRMMANAGVCIVLAGNKLVNRVVVPADGVVEEVEIARGKGMYLVPIGATGHVAKELWQQVSLNPPTCFRSARIEASLATLGDENAAPEALVEATIDILKELDR
jgi:hypothetical protein